MSENIRFSLKFYSGAVDWWIVEFLTRQYMLISSMFFQVVVPIYNLYASIFPPIMLLTLKFWILSSKDVEILERCFSWSTSLDENLVVVYFNYLVSYDRCSVSGLRLTSSLPIFFNSTSCFYINLFNCSCCLSDHEIMSSNIWSDQ